MHRPAMGNARNVGRATRGVIERLVRSLDRDAWSRPGAAGCNLPAGGPDLLLDDRNAIAKEIWYA